MLILRTKNFELPKISIHKTTIQRKLLERKLIKTKFNGGISVRHRVLGVACEVRQKKGKG